MAIPEIFKAGRKCVNIIIAENSSVAPRFKNFPTFYRTERFITIFTIACHWFLY
jgi:hypothetical protein